MHYCTYEFLYQKNKIVIYIERLHSVFNYRFNYRESKDRLFFNFDTIGNIQYFINNQLKQITRTIVSSSTQTENFNMKLKI